MAKRAALFRIFDRDTRGYAWIDVRSIRGVPRVREPLSDAKGQPISYRDERTGRSPSRAAQEAAEARYAELVRGRVVTPTDRVLTTATADELVAAWLDAIETPRNKASVDIKAGYARLWKAFFADDAKIGDDTRRWSDRRTPLERMLDDGAVYDLALQRLTCVLRKTVRKEQGALFAFFDWAKAKHLIAAVPARPSLPKGNVGVRAGKQRAKPVDIEPAEAVAIIAELPEWSKAAQLAKPRPHQSAFRVRAPLEFMWEMGQRGATIERLSVPENWSPGEDSVEIRAEDDKVGYARRVKLTDRAKKILEDVAPKKGLIFGTHDYREYVKIAALKVLPPAKAKAFARYDFRHGRINDLVDETGDILGAGQIVGHLQPTTTNAYLRAKQRQGNRVIDAMNARAKGKPHPPRPHGGGTKRARAPKTDSKTPVFQSGRGDSNPRPLDPQTFVSDESLGISGGFGSNAFANLRQDQPPTDSFGARSGHTAISAIVRARVVEDGIWDAFDLFSFHASAVEMGEEAS